MTETAAQVRLWTRQTSAAACTGRWRPCCCTTATTRSPSWVRRGSSPPRGAWTTEEYYYLAEPDSLAEAARAVPPVRVDLAPQRPQQRRQRRPRRTRRRAGRAAQNASPGVLPIAAVDNFHLPFRPAFHDVHAAHLLVVYRITDTDVYVSDAQPPAFQGPIPIATPCAAGTRRTPLMTPTCSSAPAPATGAGCTPVCGSRPGDRPGLARPGDPGQRRPVSGGVPGRHRDPGSRAFAGISAGCARRSPGRRLPAGAERAVRDRWNIQAQTRAARGVPARPGPAVEKRSRSSPRPPPASTPSRTAGPACA